MGSLVSDPVAAVAAIACFFLVPAAAVAQGAAIGQFDGHGDVGPVKTSGSASYDAALDRYRLSGSGANMWATQDEFQFAWKKMKGDFLLTARVRFEGAGVDQHRKIGWIIRQDLDPASPYVDIAVHGSGLTSLQFRRAAGGESDQIVAPILAADVIQLERKGGKYTMRVAWDGEPFVSPREVELDLPDDVYVGLFVCSHNADVVEKAIFDNVRITVPAADDFVPYRDFIGSKIEIMDMETGARTIVHSAPDSLQAPNWTVDGKALIYNHNGRLFRFDLASKEVTEIDSGFATANNNDHVLSFDGKMLGISHRRDNASQSIVYTLPITGGTPKEITPTGPSYLHGFSPDGKWLVFTGGRNGVFDIYKIPAGGGDEIQLTHTDGLDDGPEFSPDGRQIYFNSTRTGRMQIWRMQPGGFDPEQVTDDEFNNWFPHIAPDGKSMVFLSFSADVAAEDHPFYKHVYLRQMPLPGGPPRVIAYVYGGQGTINVPSWSPDGKRIAFVSNTAGD